MYVYTFDEIKFYAKEGASRRNISMESYFFDSIIQQNKQTELALSHKHLNY